MGIITRKYVIYLSSHYCDDYAIYSKRHFIIFTKGIMSHCQRLYVLISKVCYYMPFIECKGKSYMHIYRYKLSFGGFIEQEVD